MLFPWLNSMTSQTLNFWPHRHEPPCLASFPDYTVLPVTNHCGCCSHSDLFSFSDPHDSSYFTVVDHSLFLESILLMQWLPLSCRFCVVSSAFCWVILFLKKYGFGYQKVNNFEPKWFVRSSWFWQDWPKESKMQPSSFHSVVLWGHAGRRRC